ncbi:MAG: multi-sensor signal transduction histidine kinase [Candidatus Solibacter sp.]|nr:multi-sensor signal transduction histidine kinase [Candidatus Solibacter sp.]
MAPSGSVDRDSLIILHAPIGRDAQLLHTLLQRAMLSSKVCSSINDLCGEVARGVAAAFVTEEALDTAAIEKLSAVLQKQGAWSDLPLVVLTVGGEPTQAIRERLTRLEPLGDLTLLERPLRSDTIVSAARTALRARAKQYEVRRRDAELQLVTDNVPVLISYIDREQIHRRVNHTYYEWFGIPTDGVVGMSVWALNGEAYYANAKPYIAEALRGQRVTFESQLWDKRHALRDVSVSYAPDVGMDGAVRGFVALVQDITERKRTEKALRESGQRLQFLGELGEATRALTDPSVVMAIIARMTGEHLGVSRCAYADVEPDEEIFTVQYDYTAEGCESATGTYRLSCFGPGFVAHMRAGRTVAIRDVAQEMADDAGGDMFRAIGIGALVCCPLVKENKLIAMMSVHQSEPRDWTLEETGLVETVADRSWAYIERSRAQSEVRASEQQFRTLADTIPHLAWMAYADGHIFWYNQRWYDYTGSTPNLMEGWGWQNVHDSEILPAVMESWRHSLNTGEPFEMVFPLRGADGTFRLFLTRVAPVRDNSGTVVRWFGTHTDIDVQKRSEEALRRANCELEEFAYVASHDLQEPLRMVNIYTQLLLKRLGPQATPQLREYADYVSAGVRRMEVLIRDLLTYSRITHKGDEPDESRADLGAALRQAIQSVNTRVEENHAEVTHDPLPVVPGDEGQLGHVFQNLLSNALKYRKKDETPRIHVSVQRRDSHWLISVADNGIGFEQEQASRIFGLFKRLHREDEYPGTGLGLAICKRIVERYRGRIWAQSEPGVGSTFLISLPGLSNE